MGGVGDDHGHSACCRLRGQGAVRRGHQAESQLRTDKRLVHWRDRDATRRVEGRIQGRGAALGGQVEVEQPVVDILECLQAEVACLRSDLLSNKRVNSRTWRGSCHVRGIHVLG